MNRPTSRLMLLGAAALVAVVPPSAAASPAAAAPAPAAATADSPHHEGAVLELARLCIDPRHVALVANAQVHGRTFTLAEALGWCDDR